MKKEKKINKLDKPLAQLTKRQKDRNQIIKIRNEEGDIIRDTELIHRIIRTYSKSLYSIKLEILNERDNFLDIYHLPKLRSDKQLK